MNYFELMENYGRTVGIVDMQIDPEGAFLDLDGVSITVRHEPDFDRLTLLADIGEVSAARRLALADKLLTVSFATMLNGGLAIALEQATGKYLCVSSLLLTGLDVRRFEEELIQIRSKSQAARRLIEIDEQVGSQTESAASAPLHDLSSMIRA